MAREESVIKTLTRGLIDAGDVYARMKMAWAGEADAKRKEDRKFALDKRGLQLKEEIAAVNAYISTIQRNQAEKELEWKKGEPGRAQGAREDQAKLTRTTNQQRIDAQTQGEKDVLDYKSDQEAKAKEERDAEIEEMGLALGWTAQEITTAQNADAPTRNAMALDSWKIQNRKQLADDMELTDEEREIYIATGNLPDEDAKSFVDEYIDNKNTIDSDPELDEETKALLHAANRNKLQQQRQNATADKLKLLDDELAAGRITAEEHKRGREKALGTGVTGGADKPSDINVASDQVAQYEIGSDHRQMLDIVGTNIENPKTRRSVNSTLLPYLGDTQNIADMNEDIRKEASQVIANIARVHSPNGESIEKLDTANLFIARNLPSLHKQYKELKAKGYDLGKIRQLEEGVARMFGGTDNAEVRAFQAELDQMLEHVLRIRTGAVISEGEIKQAKGVTPNPDVEEDVSDVLFYSLANYTTRQAEILYTVEAGPRWGTWVAKDVFEKTYAVRDELHSTIFTPAVKDEINKIVDDVTGGTDGTNN